MQAAERYILGQVKLGLATREAACDAQMNHLSELLRSAPAIGQEECSDLFDYLEADRGTFSKDQRRAIAQLAQTRAMH